jgi:Uma2 family endonuclease
MNEKPLHQPVRKATIDDYMLAERSGGAARSELMNGRVMPRPGSNRWHSLIVSNITVALGSRMSGHKSEIYVGNMRVRLGNNLVTYPDLVVVNGEPSFADPNMDLLLNPTIIFEVISSATNTADKTQKLESFLAMDSIKECVVLKEDEMRVEHYAKQNPKQWIYRIYNERDDIVSLESIGCKVSLSEIYAAIKFRQTEISSKAVN